MDSAKYSVHRWRYLGLFVLCVGLAWFCYEAAPEFRRPGKLYIVAAAMALCAPFALWELVTASDLTFDSRGIRYKWRSVAWRDVMAVRVSCTSTTQHRGLLTDYDRSDHRVGDVDVAIHRTSVAMPQLIVIPVESGQENIVVETRSGKFTIRGASLALPPGGVLAVAQRMIDLQKAVLGEHGAARARLGIDQEARPASTVEAATAPPPLPRPSFGRKGIA